MKVSGSTPQESLKPGVPDWHKNAVIYEVNLRQYTQEGTLWAFRRHIPRLKDLGIGILWFMPIHPVSEKNRKGQLGSPYAVSDYRAINPEFGTMEEFRSVLHTVQDAGLYVIIDWVPNHTGWDHCWISEHPEWYTTDNDGNITDPINPYTGQPWGWTDVADLDYGNPAMREAMIAEMTYWVEEIGVDGFRVDVAHGVPVDFWEEATAALYAIKPLFILAEAEVPSIVNSGAFVMDYGWEMHRVLNGIARSQSANKESGNLLVMGNMADTTKVKVKVLTALDIDRQLTRQKAIYHRGYKMHFTSNHDENAWAGTEFQRLGTGHKAFAVLVCTFDGMPLIYSGQESAVDEQFSFFDKDTIPWGDYRYSEFYRKLFALKKRNKALWNGDEGGPLVKIPTGNDESVYAFIRSKAGDRVVVVINLSARPQEITFGGGEHKGTYIDIFSGEELQLTIGWSTGLAPWEYLVLEGKKSTNTSFPASFS
jgi:glycosidase